MRTIYESCKNKFATCVIWRRACQDCDRDDDESSYRPRESPLRHVRKQRVAESVEQEGNEVVANVYQELVPALRHVILVRKRYDPHDELTA